MGLSSLGVPSTSSTTTLLFPSVGPPEFLESSESEKFEPPSSPTASSSSGPDFKSTFYFVSISSPPGIEELEGSNRRKPSSLVTQEKILAQFSSGQGGGKPKIEEDKEVVVEESESKTDESDENKDENSDFSKEDTKEVVGHEEVDDIGANRSAKDDPLSTVLEHISIEVAAKDDSQVSGEVHVVTITEEDVENVRGEGVMPAASVGHIDYVKGSGKMLVNSDATKVNAVHGVDLNKDMMDGERKE
ncbi:hypothetical protein U1Q18_017857 [Sarracenia purpurea var. burkii]